MSAHTVTVYQVSGPRGRGTVNINPADCKALAEIGVIELDFEKTMEYGNPFGDKVHVKFYSPVSRKD